MDKVAALMMLLLFLSVFQAQAAPIRPVGPVTIEGTIQEVRWYPEKFVKGTPGMSGSAGKDRTFPARYVIRLTDLVLREPIQGNAAKFESTGGATIMLNHKVDDGFLKKGMRIIVFHYREQGDEGGTWTSFDRLEVVNARRGEP
ncbi:MAG TPA: hypothetical protein DCZ69_14800 [Syntrophobacteraceae bacterium]|nr:hypothetical protein [Syntrophobacteraceae bacterium]HBZ54453.1 hypothetical protein [Syntrophobacteraceae bacterium]